MGELRIRLKNHTEVIYDVIERRNVGKTDEFSEFSIEILPIGNVIQNCSKTIFL